MWGSPSGMIQSPLKISTPSPKLSERVTSPLATSSIPTATMARSPSRGVGIGSTWSAALDEQLNKIGSENISQKSALKDSGKENITGSHVSIVDSSKSDGITKPAKTIIHREILSPELVNEEGARLFMFILNLLCVYF